MHPLIIKSPVKQKVVLSMHQYHWKHYHGQCSYYFSQDDSDEFSRIMLQKPGENILRQGNPGSTHYFEVELDEG